ncbi:MAG: glycosyltransferase family 4 protein [Cyanobium sp.]
MDFKLMRQAMRDRWRWRNTRSQLARVTIVSQFFPPDFAATGQFIDQISRGLAARGIQNLVLSGQPGYAFHSDRADRIEFHPNRCIRRTSLSRFWPQRIRGRVVNSLLFSLRTFLRLLRQARRGDLLLFSTEPAYLPVIGWFTRLLTRAPYVLLLYDIYPDIAVSLGVVSRSHPLVRLWFLLQERALDSAEEVIVLSSSMAEHLRSHYPEIATPISVLPSWADPQWIQPLPKAENWFVQRHSLQNIFIVLYSGNQGRCHDLTTLLDAASLLQDEQRIRVLIVGSGAQHDQLVSRVNQESLGNVMFLPYQDANALPTLLAAADLAVVSLLASAEGQVAPSKLYGHLAAGSAVALICSPHSYLRDELERGRFGAAFGTGQAKELALFIRQLAEDPVRCQQLGQAARQHLLATATPDIVLEAYADLLSRHLPLGEKSYASPLPQTSPKFT